MNHKSVFISYASEDLAHAQRLYDDLKSAGLDPWFDKVNLLPGQRWRPAVRDAIKRSRYFIALVSESSTNKIGYVQSEFRQALDVLDEFPDSDIYVIPARVDDSEPSYEKLREIQWVDLFPVWSEGIDRILRAMNLETSESDDRSETLRDSGSDEDENAETPAWIQIDFSTVDSPESLKDRMFAIIAEWVEFDHVRTSYGSLNFPGGSFSARGSSFSDNTLAQIRVSFNGLPPLDEVFKELEVPYERITFALDGNFDIGDLVARSRGGVRKRESLSTSGITFLVATGAKLTIKNLDENSSTVTISDVTFKSDVPPLSYSTVSAYLNNDPPGDELDNSINARDVNFYGSL